MLVLVASSKICLLCPSTPPPSPQPPPAEEDVQQADEVQSLPLALLILTMSADGQRLARSEKPEDGDGHQECCEGEVVILSNLFYNLPIIRRKSCRKISQNMANMC